jgi:hypothetical protein
MELAGKICPICFGKCLLGGVCPGWGYWLNEYSGKNMVDLLNPG